MSIRVYPYKSGSQSARLLARAVNGMRIKLRGTRYRPRRSHLVINWGNADVPAWNNEQVRWLNNPANIRNASNKIRFFELTEGLDVLEYTREIGEARRWAESGDAVYVRNSVAGRAGEGIEVVTEAGEIGAASLYTRGVRKAREYRAHVNRWNGVFLLYQKKRRDPDASSEVKTHNNGWIYAMNDITQPPAGYEQSILAVLERIGLDFAAIDFLVKDGRVYVIEANSAPGIEGHTLEAYQEQFNEVLR